MMHHYLAESAVSPGFLRDFRSEIALQCRRKERTYLGYRMYRPECPLNAQLSQVEKSPAMKAESQVWQNTIT